MKSRRRIGGAPSCISLLIRKADIVHVGIPVWLLALIDGIQNENVTFFYWVLLASLISVRRWARSSPAPRCATRSPFSRYPGEGQPRGRSLRPHRDRPRFRSADQPDEFRTPACSPPGVMAGP